MLEGFKSLFSATAVEKILNEDAIILGRLNCDEFAMGSSNENSIYGPVKNQMTKKFQGVLQVDPLLLWQKAFAI